MPRLPVLLLGRGERARIPAARVGGARPESVRVPRTRVDGDGPRPRPEIRHGSEALALLEVAPPPALIQPGSLLVGFAVGAVVAARRSGVRHP